MLAALGLLATLCGCTSGIEACRKAYPPGSAAYEACFQAELQRENQRLNQQAISELQTSR